MISLKRFHLRLLFGAVLFFFTLSLHINKSNAEPITPSLVARQNDPYPDEEQISAEMSVEKDKSVFYSGCPDGERAAESLAMCSGRKTLSMSLPKGYLRKRGAEDDPLYGDFLGRVSRIYAEKSSGTAHFVSPLASNMGNSLIWTNYEYPALTAEDGQVDKIVQVECGITDQVKEIFNRNNETNLDSNTTGNTGLVKACVIARDYTWEFSMYQNNACTGQAMSEKGEGSNGCQTGLLNGSVNSLIVSDLGGKCKIKFFKNNKCEDQGPRSMAIPETQELGCADLKNIESWRVDCI